MSLLHSIHDYLKSGETDKKDLGLEIEHFIVDMDGKQIEFDEISSLVKKVADDIGADVFYTDGYPVGYHNGQYSVTLEPSCQFEISVDPYEDLSDIEGIYNKFYNTWNPIFEERGYKFVTKGNLPLVEQGYVHPDSIPLSPKKRYKYMDDYFKKSGKYGKYMMRASASTQISVDYKSESDMIRKLRLLQIISPILMIMLESKSDQTSTLPGAEDKPHLLRIQEWDDLDDDRTGFFPNSFDDDFGYKKIAEVVYNTPLILLSDQGETTYVEDKSAKDLVDSGVIEEIEDSKRQKDLIEHIFSMGFFHYRIKKYIEIRVADSVDIKKALGYVALIKGIFYSDSLMDALEEKVSDINSIDLIEASVEKIERDGLDAIIYHNVSAEDWIEYLIQLAEKGLVEHEKRYLDHVRTTRSDIK